MTDKMRARWRLAISVYECLLICAATALSLGALVDNDGTESIAWGLLALRMLRMRMTDGAAP